MRDFTKLESAIRLSVQISEMLGWGLPYNRVAQSMRREAQALGRKGIAGELLPALLGGTWVESDSPEYNWPIQPKSECAPFDHPCLYRRRGARGRPTWNNSALIGQPYEGPSAFHAEAWAIVAGLAREGVTLWHSKQHSYWFPDWTTLIVAARGVEPARATALGFQHVSACDA